MRARASARNRYGDEGEELRKWQKRNRLSEEEGENMKGIKRKREREIDTGA